MHLFHCLRFYLPAKLQSILKALLHCATFRATCLAMALRDNLHESLPDVTYLARCPMSRCNINVARPAAATVAEGKVGSFSNDNGNGNENVTNLHI